MVVLRKWPTFDDAAYVRLDSTAGNIQGAAIGAAVLPRISAREDEIRHRRERHAHLKHMPAARISGPQMVAQKSTRIIPHTLALTDVKIMHLIGAHYVSAVIEDRIIDRGRAIVAAGVEARVVP